MDEPEEKHSGGRIDLGVDKAGSGWSTKNQCTGRNGVDGRHRFGDALHAALFVYRNHFENGRKMFEEKIKEQDAALRALTLQILATEREINNTFEYFSGQPLRICRTSLKRGNCGTRS